MKTDVVELDITYKCTLSCNSCTRRCDLISGIGTDITQDTISNFLDEIVTTKHKYNQIILMGGEPTIHPHLADIITQLLVFKQKYPVKLLLVSNYHTFYTKEVIKNLPLEIETRLAYKDRKTKTGSMPSSFWTMNIAPCDFQEFEGIDYSVGCMQQKHCGLQYTPDGKYYICSMAGGIDRMFLLNLGASLKEILVPEVQREQLRKLCGFCGRFRLKYEPRLHGGAHELNFDTQEKTEMYLKNVLGDWPLRSGHRYLSKSWEDKAFERNARKYLTTRKSGIPDESYSE